MGVKLLFLGEKKASFSPLLNLYYRFLSTPIEQAMQFHVTEVEKSHNIGHKWR